MSGIEFLADTNAVVYLLAGNECMTPFLNKNMAVSVITVMELLSFPDITDQQEKTIRSFLEQCEILQITDNIREKTIHIRRSNKTKLPDAIIAATSIVHDIPLLTADIGFCKIKDLKIEQLSPA